MMSRKFVIEPGEPPDQKQRGRKSQYTDALNTIIGDNDSHDLWILLASYTAATGARDALKRIRNGEIDTPSPNSWEYRAVSEGKEDGTESELYARYHTEWADR
jgi:hypothetical protein